MPFTCIRSCLIKRIMSRVLSSWWDQQTRSLTAWIRLHSGRAMSSFSFFFSSAFVTEGGKRWYTAYVPGDLKLKHTTQREAEYENRDKGSIKHERIKGKCQHEVDWEERKGRGGKKRLWRREVATCLGQGRVEGCWQQVVPTGGALRT